MTESSWADGLRTELVWLSSTLADEHAYAARLDRLMDALHRLSGSSEVPAPRGSAGALTVGSARAGALLERQLTLARTRSHSATLQALGSARFHAVADAVAVLASEVPLNVVAARGRVDDVLVPLAAVAETRLSAAVTTLPPAEDTHPYNADHDGRWHEVRRLLRVHRYAREALGEDVTRAAAAGEALDRHRDAAEAAAASATAARTPASPRPRRTPWASCTRTSATRPGPRASISGRSGSLSPRSRRDNGRVTDDDACVWSRRNAPGRPPRFTIRSLSPVGRFTCSA